MKLDHIDEATVRIQATSAGFATAELYIQSLLQQDAERLAIQEGIEDFKQGRHRPFNEFDRQFREKNGLPAHD